jgi:ribose 5-phosphate isomerase B
MKFKALAFAADHRGYWLKTELIEYFSSIGYQITDFGTDSDCVSVDFPDYAKKLAKYVLSNPNTCGILTCYSGVGMSIAANRFKGIRAVWCNNEKIAQISREHNDANVICFGSGFIGKELAMRCTETFATTELIDQRYLVRVNKIDED